jgi:hypothetical protein
MTDNENFTMSLKAGISGRRRSVCMKKRDAMATIVLVDDTKGYTYDNVLVLSRAAERILEKWPREARTKHLGDIKAGRKPSISFSIPGARFDDFPSALAGLEQFCRATRTGANIKSDHGTVGCGHISSNGKFVFDFF